MRSRLGSVSYPYCFRPARSIRSLTTEHPTRIRIPSDQREPRDLSDYPAGMGISGFGCPVGSAGLLNCLTPGESDPYSRSLSNPFRLILLRTLPFSVHNSFPSKLFSFNLFHTLSQNTGGGMGFFPFWNRASDKDASPERAQRAEGSLPFFRASRNTSHESQVTNHE